MSLEAIHNTIRKRFGDNVQVPENLDTHYDNSPHEHVQPVHARVTILLGESLQTTIGASKRYRTPGTMVVQIFVPVADGDARALQLADKVNAEGLFRSVTADGITWRKPSTTRLGTVDEEYQVNVSCPFFFEEYDQ